MELKGYSGCTLIVVTQAGRKCVKKISSRKSYNQRLVNQKEKQESLRIEGFLPCNVYSDGYDGEEYYFIMQYINGRTLADEIKCMKLSGVHKIAEVLQKIIKEYKEPNLEANQIFQNKIDELKKNIECRTAVLNDALKILEQFSWKYVVSSACHGDMTLENILVKDGKLYLIDCLDSFYDSWQIDMAKIFQDTELYWSYRDKKMDSNLLVRLTILQGLMQKYIMKMRNGEELLETVYHVLLLNLLRIYPYSKDLETKQFLDEKVISIMRKIKGRGWRVKL